MNKQGVEKGRDSFGAEYKRTAGDFRFRKLEQDNCVCSICHGTGAKMEVQYITKNYMSPKTKKICKTLQAHEHSFWICRPCAENMVRKSGGVLRICWPEDDLVKDINRRMTAIRDEAYRAGFNDGMVEGYNAIGGKARHERGDRG